jgi:hypothetical protein
MNKNIFFVLGIAFTVIAFTIDPSQAWELPPDNGTVGKDVQSQILSGNDYPETTTYTKDIYFLDFISYGKKFTQVVIRLNPSKPRIHKSKKLVLVHASGGTDSVRDMIETVEEKEGILAWLARRGFTVIALERIGRWNFLAKDGSGSWEDIPLGERMPIFNRDQKTNWSPKDYKREEFAGSINRFPKPGTELYNQMLAATPVTLMRGFQKGLKLVLEPEEREGSIVLYWGMSTGGAFVWPLAKYFKPDGYLGWAPSSTGLAWLYRKATQGKFGDPYGKSFLRVKENGRKGFDFYTRHIDQATKDAWWPKALRSPRFRSVEDLVMMFNIGAVAEMAVRLWMAEFLPIEYKKAGFAKFMKDMLEPSFPPKELRDVPALEMHGTLDEVINPKAVDAYREVMEPYCAKYRVARIQGLHHRPVTQDEIKVVGTFWLRFIESGYFE